MATGLQGLLEGIKEGDIYVDLSTSGPTLVRRIEPLFRQKGAHMLDAPVSGGPAGAASGNLAVMVGGEQEVYERVKPILDAFGDKAFYAGDIGAGSVSKLVHNMISHGVWQAVAEGMTLGVKAGVDAKSLWECVRRGAMGRMNTLHERLPRSVFLGKFEPPGMYLRVARKDIGLATELGKEYDVPMPIANLAEQIAIQGLNRGWERRTAASPSSYRRRPRASRYGPRASTRRSRVGSSPPTLKPSKPPDSPTASGGPWKWASQPGPRRPPAAQHH